MININSAWEELKEQIKTCEKCKLCQTRNNIVLGEGNIENQICRVVIVGEAPGEEEDATGRPFVGKAGQLLTNILEKGGGIERSSVYITNTVKCRPPGNRNPLTGEVLACSEYLETQLLLLCPDIVVTMGNIPTHALLKVNQGITSLRGKWYDWRGIKLFPMFHPSFLLRNESREKGSPKDLTWQDVKALKAKIDEITRLKRS